MPSQRGHGFDAGRLEILHLAAGNIGDLEQAVLAGEDGVAMVGPSAQRTISAGDRPRWHRGSNKGLELSPRTARIMGIVGQTQRRARPIAALHMGMLRHHALDLRQKVGIEPRSEEHTSELQSLMRNSYAVF